MWKRGIVWYRKLRGLCPLCGAKLVLNKCKTFTNKEGKLDLEFGYDCNECYDIIITEIATNDDQWN